MFADGRGQEIMAILTNGPIETGPILILAHGAGAPMDTPFMTFFAEGLGAAGIGVIRFEFPYMAARRTDGKKRPPDRAPKLLDTWREIVGRYSGRDVFIGGKSMGGRMATLLASEDPEEAIKGVICLGYPFHPPGKPEKLRVEHFPDIRAPVLICQGERDSFGKRDEVKAMALPESFDLHWCPDGDHDLKPRKASGLTAEENWRAAVAAVADFIRAGR